MAAPDSWTASMNAGVARRSWKTMVPMSTPEMGSRVAMTGRLAVSGAA